MNKTENRSSQGIEIRNLYKIFGPQADRHLEAAKNGIGKTELNRDTGHVIGLRDINISMPGGEITVVMGLSGSGKSTLIRHINRLIEPTAGEVLYDGDDVCRMTPSALRDFRRRKTAMVFQKFGLLPHRTVMENAVYGLDIQRVPRSESVKTGRYWLERVGLNGYEDHYPNQLSGGMQQRVGLARALANDADILLMDEAYSALDPLIRVDMQTMLLDLQDELKKTVVFITHDLDEALRLGDKIVILRDGEVVQQGSGQDIVLNPANDYISAFVREVNRGRVIRISTIMSQPRTLSSHLKLRGATTLETAARAMVESEVSAAHVTDKTGKIIGTIDLSGIVGAMVNRTAPPMALAAE
ncbi:quaternary amine ABC transporter ATP-binding protein [Rhizobium paknamense]|uniref:Quaternary amine transport ATP-binding protein n=1 Tax=Rhizobium paknamense TaxID=1206817 RepID=A0ABU0I6G6_9HYPH|nr:glycine betaine/L-proline ABC transporter ATP-binding protein [Rhizobium paknamense]MDQ0453798.1 glycine betaine/proline transport system ATP-binding protein [Rhizobium paknamense]